MVLVTLNSENDGTMVLVAQVIWSLVTPIHKIAMIVENA